MYNRPNNHFVADFLGHSNFYDAEVVGPEEELVRVRLEGGQELLADHPGDWQPGQKVELVIRAQKFRIQLKTEPMPANEKNILYGRIKQRSYMGGEVSYFVELEGSQREVHVISMMRDRVFEAGEELVMSVQPEFCRVLPVNR